MTDQTSTITPTIHPTIHPTRQARSVHLAHLATTHRAPLVASGRTPGRTRAAAFTPMARDPHTPGTQSRLHTHEA